MRTVAIICTECSIRVYYDDREEETSCLVKTKYNLSTGV